MQSVLFDVCCQVLGEASLLLLSSACLSALSYLGKEMLLQIAWKMTEMRAVSKLLVRLQLVFHPLSAGKDYLCNQTWAGPGITSKQTLRSAQSCAFVASWRLLLQGCKCTYLTCHWCKRPNGEERLRSSVMLEMSFAPCSVMLSMIVSKETSTCLSSRIKEYLWHSGVCDATCGRCTLCAPYTTPECQVNIQVCS